MIIEALYDKIREKAEKDVTDSCGYCNTEELRWRMEELVEVLTDKLMEMIDEDISGKDEQEDVH